MESTNTGTEIKFLLDLKVQSTQLAMADYDFTARFYIYPNRYVEVAKSAMVATDDGCYIAVVDTSTLGVGEVKVEVEAHVPDSDAADGFREERVTISTGVVLRGSVYGLS